MKPTEALDKCIEAALFIGPLRRSGPGQVVLKMSECNKEIAEALKNLSSDDLMKLRPDHALRFTTLEKENSVLKYIIERDRCEKEHLKESLKEDINEVLDKLL